MQRLHHAANRLMSIFLNHWGPLDLGVDRVPMQTTGVNLKPYTTQMPGLGANPYTTSGLFTSLSRALARVQSACLS